MKSVSSRTSIRSKIIVAFTVVLCCTAGLGFYSLDRLIGVNAVAAEMRDTWLPSVLTLGKMTELLERIRLNQANLILAVTDERRIEVTDRLVVFPKEFDSRLMAYRSMVGTAEERASADEIDRSWTGAKQDLSQVVLSMKAQDRAGAALQLEKSNAAANLFRKALQDDIAYNSQGAARAAALGARLAKEATTMIYGALAAIAVVLVLTGIWLVRVISRPITEITRAMGRLADHDLDIVIPGLERSDEIGAMATATQVFKNNAIQARLTQGEAAEAQTRRVSEDERVRLEAEATASAAAASLVVGSIGMGLERLADGDLTFRLETPLPHAYESLRADLNSAVSRMRDALLGIVASTGSIQSGSAEIAQASDDLSRRTEQQAASLEQTAAALDEITATVRRAAEGASQAQRIARETTTDAERSSVVVQSTVKAMGEIEGSARQISQIIGVIDEIAFQTNLLALNAGVEAARAGDAGRGFAVVASEVRALAQRSAEAAKEIKALIQASTRQVDQGVKLVGETGVALDRIMGQVNQLDRAVADIAAGAQEQATGLAEVNTAVNQMDQVTQQNAAMVEQSTAASHALSQEASTLAGLTGKFRLQDGVQTAAPYPSAPQRMHSASSAAHLTVVTGGGRRGGAASTSIRAMQEADSSTQS